MADDELLSVPSAAKRLGVTRARVQQWIDAGRLAATRISDRAWVLTAAEVERFAGIERPTGRPRKKLANSA